VIQKASTFSFSFQYPNPVNKFLKIVEIKKELVKMKKDAASLLEIEEKVKILKIKFPISQFRTGLAFLCLDYRWPPFLNSLG
jgi:hypothetical protein